MHQETTKALLIQMISKVTPQYKQMQLGQVYQHQLQLLLLVLAQQTQTYLRTLAFISLSKPKPCLI